MVPYRREIGVSTVDAMEQTTTIHALALSLAKCLTPEQISRLGLLLIQLGTTLDTIAALEEMNAGEDRKTSED